MKVEWMFPSVSVCLCDVASTLGRVIAAASPWSKQTDATEGRQVPENVIVRKFSQYELRQVYDASAFLVTPLEPVDF